MVIVSVIDSESTDVVVRIEDKGTEVLKTISFQEYRNACNNVMLNGERVPRIGQLPHGFFNGGSLDGVQEAIIRIPKGKRPIHYMGKEFIIPFPDVVFHFVTEQGKPKTTKVWFADDKGVLYHYPFGNVYDDGRICWGANVLPHIADLKEMERLVSIFFDATTNNDLYKSPCVTLDGKEVQLNQRDYIEYVSRLDAFPIEWLREAGLTIEEL